MPRACTVDRKPVARGSVGTLTDRKLDHCLPPRGLALQLPVSITSSPGGHSCPGTFYSNFCKGRGQGKGASHLCADTPLLQGVPWFVLMGKHRRRLSTALTSEMSLRERMYGGCHGCLLPMHCFHFLHRGTKILAFVIKTKASCLSTVPISSRCGTDFISASSRVWVLRKPSVLGGSIFSLSTAARQHSKATVRQSLCLPYA